MSTRKRALFIDRDGTLVKEPPVDYQLDSLEKLEFVPKVMRNLYFIRERLDFEFVMVSNQDGLGTPSFPEETFWPAHNLMLKTLEGVGDNGHHVALEGVLINIVGVFLDLAAGLGNAGGVGGRQVITGLDLHLAGNAHLAVVGLVHFKGGFVVIHGVFLRLYRALPAEGSGRGFSYLLYFNRTGRAFPPEKPLFRPVPRKSRTNPALYLWNFCKILFFFTFALYNKVCTMRPESEPGGMPVFQQEELYFEKDHHKGSLPALRRCAGAGRSRLLQVR